MEKKRDYKILGIIPARAGSKRIPRKNIKELSGVPLIGHIFESARQSRMLTDLILSTDGKEIAEVGRKLGIDVPFLRPYKYSTDETKSIDVVKHAIREMERQKGITYDFGILLQPTSPLTQTYHIDSALHMLANGDYDSVTSLTAGSPFDPGSLMIKKKDSYKKLFPRQRNVKLPEVYAKYGNIYAFKRELAMRRNMLIGHKVGYVIIEKRFSVNIDDHMDWEVAEALVAYHKKIKKN